MKKSNKFSAAIAAFKKRDRKKGATLYELVISIALIAIILGASIALITAVTNFTNTYNRSTAQLREMSTLRTLVENWFYSLDTDEYTPDIIVQEGGSRADEEKEVYTVYFSDREGNLYFLTFADHTLYAQSPTGIEELYSADTVKAIDFSYRSGTALYRCTVTFENGIDYTFMLRSRAIPSNP